MVSQLKNVINMNLHKPIVVIVLLIIISLNIKAQNINDFYFEVNVANNLAKIKKLDSAIVTYENAFKKVDYVQITYLKKIMKLAKLTKDKERIKSYSEQIKNQRKGTNPELKDIIDSIMVLDKKVRVKKALRRSEYAWECAQNPNCNQQSKKNIKSKIAKDNLLKTDSSNIYCLLNLFKQHGFIGEELVGFSRYLGVIAIMTHFDSDTSNAILEPVFKKARNEGKIRPIHSAQILDRHLGNKYTIQKYWTWPHMSKIKFSFSEADIPQIIKLRESLGIYDSEVRQEYKQGYWILRNKNIY
jgi:uncharacterized membrane protein YciS (DUF1049 family)